MACKHEKLDFSVELVRREDVGSILVDVWCEACGTSGTARIEPNSVQWGDEAEAESENEGGATVTCSACKKPCDAASAHLHQGEYIGDECCWDERLKASE